MWSYLYCGKMTLVVRVGVRLSRKEVSAKQRQDRRLPNTSRHEEVHYVPSVGAGGRDWIWNSLVSLHTETECSHFILFLGPGVLTPAELRLVFLTFHLCRLVITSLGIQKAVEGDPVPWPRGSRGSLNSSFSESLKLPLCILPHRGSHGSEIFVVVSVDLTFFALFFPEACWNLPEWQLSFLLWPTLSVCGITAL